MNGQSVTRVIFVGLLLAASPRRHAVGSHDGCEDNIDFVWIEGILIASVVLVVPSLRPGR